MAFTLNYVKGKNLRESFFVGREATDSYKVAASDVIPLVVQAAIQSNDPDVATSDMVLEDLKSRCASLEDFKKWAKRRKAKNRKAVAKVISQLDIENVESVKTDESNGRTQEMLKDKNLEKVASEEKVVTEAPVTDQAQATTETVEATPATETKPAETANTGTDVKAALETLLKYVESKRKVQAVKIEKVEAKVDGVAKTQTAPEPKGAIKEVSKVENPKGHIATAALKVEAMDENWSVNEKELQPEAKKGKPAQALPVNFSVEQKEVAAEQEKAKTNGKAASEVKKYYNQLGDGASGEHPVSMDVKSSQEGELKFLREALAKERAEKQALIEKEKLQLVADKIYSIVTAMKQRNLLKAGREEAVVDALTQKFANLEALDGFKAVIAELQDGTTADEEQISKVVPQPIQANEPVTEDPETDAAELLSKNWNH